MYKSEYVDRIYRINYIGSQFYLSSGLGQRWHWAILSYRNCRFASVKVGADEGKKWGMPLDKEALVGTSSQMECSHALQLAIESFDPLTIPPELKGLREAVLLLHILAPRRHQLYPGLR